MPPISDDPLTPVSLEVARAALRAYTAKRAHQQAIAHPTHRATVAWRAWQRRTTLDELRATVHTETR